jgi:DegV family protein with EDD domain
MHAVQFKEDEHLFVEPLVPQIRATNAPTALAMPATAEIAPAPAPTAEPSRQRIGIVVDAACDLPESFFASPDVAVLPVTVQVGNMTYVDQHSPDSTLRFLREQDGGRGVTAVSTPQTAAEMQSMFMERFALDYDSVYCLTISSTRSQIHDHAMQGSVQALPHIREARAAAGVQRPFQMRVIDTKNLFAAQGIPALALRDLLDSDLSSKDIRDRLYQVIDATYGYLVVDDLGYMRKRARLRGDRSVGMVAAMVGGAMDIKPIVRGRLGTTTPVGKFRGRDETWNRLLAFTAKQVQRGLVTPHVIVSYGGPLSDVLDTRGYRHLASVCENEGVQLHACPMSISGMVNMGTQAICVGFAASEHSPDF